MGTSHHPKLSTSLIWFSLAMFAVAVLIVSFPIRGYLRDYESDLQAETAQRAGQALSLSVSRAVGREWDSLAAVANQVDVQSYDGMRRFTDAVVLASDAVAWVGIASRDGVVLAGTKGLREGDDVGFRRWFREGLEGGSVGSVYIPERTSLSGAENGLINISMPILDAFGNADGVAVYSLRLSWVSAFIRDAAEQLKVDLQVISGEGAKIIEHSPFMTAPMPDDLVELTRTGQQLTRLIVGEDGQRAVFAVQPELLTGDLPYFDWDLIVRVPARPGNESLSQFVTIVSRSIAVLFGIVSLVSIFFASHFLGPIRKLARDAQAIANGEDIYPTEDTSSRESAELSDALARLQSQVEARRAQSVVYLDRTA